MIDRVLRSNKLPWIAALLASVLMVAMYSAQTSSTVPPVPVKIGFIGDSITHGPDDTPGAVEATALALGSEYTLLNRGAGGASSQNWQPGGAMYDDTLAYFKAQRVSAVSIMLGTNDARNDIATPPATYKKNIQTIVSNLLHTPGIERVVINYPPYVVPGSVNNLWGDAAPTRLKAYIAQIDTLVDGKRILRGDTQAYAYFKTKPNELTDGVHPTAAGYEQLGKLWADAYVKTVTASSADMHLGYVRD
jgi:lysophospholipase L1-like esterase